MKVIVSGPFSGTWDYGRLSPTHGVYSQIAWDLMEAESSPISVHWDYQAAVEAAARDEVMSHPRVVVCFTDFLESA